MINITEANFESEITNSQLPIIIDLWASWCRPCVAFMPTFEKLSKEFDGRVKFCKINVEDEPELSSKFNISAIPTLIFIKNGKTVKIMVGAQKENILKQEIENLI